ncbi:C2 calcium/lipid-binding plant phosphoribosyltransferase family protein [Perilla frutescens var. frutescens]|nr:C2 calcium/lipid-binding plant phosphoribosyltransferase family protein [Perilla frutescens var. frutescens]
MAKLVVEVLDANDLMPKDGHGSASPFVEVEFEGQRKRTSTKQKSLNPSWNEKLMFKVRNPSILSSQIIEVFLYNDNKHGHHKNFLGKVRISGMSVPFSEEEATVQRYPLDKRGIFSHVKGDVALRVHALHGGAEPDDNIDVDDDVRISSAQNHHRRVPSAPLEEIDGDHEHYYKESNDKSKKSKKERDLRTFYSLGNGYGSGVPAPTTAEMPVFVEARRDFSMAGPASATTVMQMLFPEQKPEYGVVETTPPLAARMGYWGRDKTASTYDMVEPMNFLYVSVVKAMDLPVKDVTGSLDPYVEVKVGNYKGVTKHFEKNQNPVWNKVFAFSKEMLQSSLIEITVLDKDVSKDDFVGKVTFEVPDVPTRVPPDSPLAPQWYKLLNKEGGLLKRGDIMLAIWMGTQADEAFPGAWHSDAYSVNEDHLNTTRSKVYYTPRLYYLRVHVIAAQDLVPSDSSKPPDPIVRVEIAGQGRTTRAATTKGFNPEWNQELMYVASEPLNDYIRVSVEDNAAGGETIGRCLIPVRDVPKRVETTKPTDAIWYVLQKVSVAGNEEDQKKDKFASRVLLRLSIDSGYHVLDESIHFSSDLQPAAGQLRKPSVGILEVGILGARNLQPMKKKEGKLTDAYCVAKYGNKWVRTRTLIDNLHPLWNEQYTWDVYDSCTVITIAVFDNCHINGKDGKDQRIGKVRIRLSTLETDRVYTHAYPLLVITPSGLKKNGELHLAVRFTCTAWVNLLAQYSRPLLPKMHYIQPIHIKHIDLLRHFASTIVSSTLSRAEPPLGGEVIEYMTDVDYHIFSLRRSKANFQRLMLVVNVIQDVSRWFHDICQWKKPLTTILVHMLFLILVCYPELIMPTFFLYLFSIGLWNYRLKPRHPPHMDAALSHAENNQPDELEEEFEPFPTPISRSFDILRMRYDRLRTVAGRVQTVSADMAMQAERVLSLLSWRDPRATAIFTSFSFIWAVFLYITPFQIVALIIGLFVLRHPRFRYKVPPIPVNFFKRLPSRSDSLL